MIITIQQINRAGFGDEVVKKYQALSKVQKMIEDIKKGGKMPSIIVYPCRNGLYTIADGCHRISAYLFLGITSFETNIK